MKTPLAKVPRRLFNRVDFCDHEEQIDTGEPMDQKEISSHLTHFAQNYLNTEYINSLAGILSNNSDYCGILLRSEGFFQIVDESIRIDSNTPLLAVLTVMARSPGIAETFKTNLNLLPLIRSIGLSTQIDKAVYTIFKNNISDIHLIALLNAMNEGVSFRIIKLLYNHRAGRLKLYLTHSIPAFLNKMIKHSMIYISYYSMAVEAEMIEDGMDPSLVDAEMVPDLIRVQNKMVQPKAIALLSAIFRANRKLVDMTRVARAFPYILDTGVFQAKVEFVSFLNLVLSNGYHIEHYLVKYLSVFVDICLSTDGDDLINAIKLISGIIMKNQDKLADMETILLKSGIFEFEFQNQTAEQLIQTIRDELFINEVNQRQWVQGA